MFVQMVARFPQKVFVIIQNNEKFTISLILQHRKQFQKNVCTVIVSCDTENNCHRKELS